MENNCIESGEDCNHGTEVMGVAAGNYEDVKGVAPDANLILIEGQDKEAALKYVADVLINQYDIVAVNMSFAMGGFCEKKLTDGMQKSINKIVSSGIAVIAGAGNSGLQNHISNPACRENVVSVGATSVFDDKIASFSNNSRDLDLLAPGAGVYTLKKDSKTGKVNGTSFSSPFVAGAWALVKSANPDATVKEILEAFKKTGKKVLDTRRLLSNPLHYDTKKINSQGLFNKNSKIFMKKNLTISDDYIYGPKSYEACIIQNNKILCFNSGKNELNKTSFNSEIKNIIFGLNDIKYITTNTKVVGINTDYFFEDNNISDFDLTYHYKCVVSNNKLKCKTKTKDYRDILTTANSLDNVKEIELDTYVACAINDNKVTCWGDGAKVQGLENTPTELENPKNLKLLSTLACVIDEREDGNKLYCWGRGAKYIDTSKFNDVKDYDIYTTVYPYDSSSRKSSICVIENNEVVCNGNYLSHAGFDVNRSWNVSNPHAVALNSHSICVLGNSLECHYAKEKKQDTPVIIKPRIQVDKAIEYLLNK